MAITSRAWHRKMLAIEVDRLFDGIADEPITNAVVLVQDENVAVEPAAGRVRG
jgi:hypothetical protein